ncbi:hypothetical protein BGZ97_001165 [Linnemannia gamsii]|uniref:Uncharacterized protein n=1 Tax=Linnemannia gamsii TaxID=64522 RepID=A0A9P6QWV5_9FUNG|nr:hypothetical protein BGZ97_001165 [Linnemannia gamsii]
MKAEAIRTQERKEAEASNLSLSTAGTESAAVPSSPGQPLPKAKVEPGVELDSAAAAASSATAKNDENVSDPVKPSSPNTERIVHESRVEQLDKMKLRADECFQSPGNSFEALEPDMTGPPAEKDKTDTSTEPDPAVAGTHDKVLIIKSQNARAFRAAGRSGVPSAWCKEDTITKVKKESAAIGDPTKQELGGRNRGCGIHSVITSLCNVAKANGTKDAPEIAGITVTQS